MKRVLPIAAVAVLAGAGGLVWYASSGPDTDAASQTEAKRPTAPRHDPSRLPPKPFQTTRKATEADIPATAAAALARPEVKRNQAAARLRADFAAKRFDAVVTRSREILDQEDRPEVRAYLTMALCAKGDDMSARTEHAKLPAERQRLVALRCSSFGVEM